MNIHAAKSTDPAENASDVATPSVSSDITQPTGLKPPARAADPPVRRPSGVARYFRKSRDRAAREATVGDPPVNAQGDTGVAEASTDKAVATKRALQAAENEGWK
jgi:hypothetical protein